MYYCKGMKRSTMKSWITPHAFSSHIEKWLFQSTTPRVWSAWSSKCVLPSFLKPRALNPTTSFIHPLTHTISLHPWWTRDPWKWLLSADPLRPTSTLVVSALLLPARDCNEVKFRWLPLARFPSGQFCADAIDSVHPCSEVSSPPQSWLLSTLGTGPPFWECGAKQSPLLPPSFWTLLLSQKMWLVNSVSFCKHT